MVVVSLLNDALDSTIKYAIEKATLTIFQKQKMQDLHLLSVQNQFISPDLMPLIAFLEKSEKKSAVWQEETGRLSSLAHLKSMSTEINDIEYLMSLALCRWAQVSGVSEAKKKTISPIRFRTKDAPLINDISNAQLFYFSLDLLSSIRAGWCFDYISETSKSSQLNKKSIDLLGKWIGKNCSTFSEIVRCLVLPSFEGNTDAPTKNLLVTQTSSLSKKIIWDSPQSASKDFAEAASLIADFIALKTNDKKTSASLCGLLTVFVTRLCESQPFAIMEGDFLISLQHVFNNLSVPKFKKTFQDLQLKLSELTSACMLGLVQRGGSQEIQNLKPLLPLLGSLYKNFNKRLDELSRVEPLLKDLFSQDVSVRLQVTEDGAASVYSRLLPDWHSFSVSKLESPEVSVLNSMLLQAAALNGIEWLGETRDVCLYDPKLHQIISGEPPIGKQVKIVRPAIIYKRGAQSYRIVLRGIVELV
jgi:hypothetical protein